MGRMLQYGPGRAVHAPDMLQHGAKRFQKASMSGKFTVRPVWRMGRMILRLFWTSRAYSPHVPESKQMLHNACT